MTTRVTSEGDEDGAAPLRRRRVARASQRGQVDAAESPPRREDRGGHAQAADHAQPAARHRDAGRIAQILLLDTPGLHEGSKPLDVAMRDAVTRATEDCDVALLLVDAAQGFEPVHAEWLARLAKRGVPVLLVAAQIDRPECARAPWPPPGVEGLAATLRISARTGEGVEALLAEILSRLPEGPPHFPADQLTDRPLRFVAAEFVREAAFLELSQELPYRLAVDLIEFDERDPKLTRIRANLLVERDSQKRIAIGTRRRARARDRHTGAPRHRTTARAPGVSGAAREGRPGLGKAGEALEITRLSLTNSRSSVD